MSDHDKQAAEKDLLRSKTFWGAIAQVGALVANSYGVPLNADMILAGLGLVMTVVGRVAAQGNITTAAGVALPGAKAK